jgi:hypothetical protein
MTDQSELDLAAVARSLSMLEVDCDKAWPVCPRTDQLICDCRLRATRAINALKLNGRL